MLALNLNDLKKTSEWERLGVALPKFNIEQVTKNTKEKPQWVHFGAGNIFRGFVANAYQKLLDKNMTDTGIIAVDSFDFDVIDKVYKPYDNLSILVLMHSNGEFEKKVVGSVVESLAAEHSRKADMNRLIEIFEKGLWINKPYRRILRCYSKRYCEWFKPTFAHNEHYCSTHLSQILKRKISNDIC